MIDNKGNCGTYFHIIFIYLFFFNSPGSFDNVIFACPPDVALKMIEKPTWLEVYISYISRELFCLRLQNLLLSSVSYPETETTFEEGIIHNDPNVLPEQFRTDLLSKYANFIYITYEPNGMNTLIHLNAFAEC